MQRPISIVEAGAVTSNERSRRREIIVAGLLRLFAKWRAARREGNMRRMQEIINKGVLCHRVTMVSELVSLHAKELEQSQPCTPRHRSVGCTGAGHAQRRDAPCDLLAKAGDRCPFNRNLFDGHQQGDGRTTKPGLLSLLILCFAGRLTSVLSQVVACRPLLSPKAVREVRPSSSQPLPWKWHATIIADTSFCATRSGNFEVDFVRIKEYSSDLQFTQRFRWTQDQFDAMGQVRATGDQATFRNSDLMCE